MINNKIRKIMLLIFSTLIVFLFTMCDDFKDEKLKPNATDAYAIEALRDTATIDLGLASVNFDATINKYTANFGSGLDTLDSQYATVINLLNDSNAVVVPGKTHYNVALVSKEGNSILLPVSGTKEIVVYTTSQVDVQVYDNANVAMDNDDTFSAELVAGIFDYNPDDPNDYPKPVVKTRNAFELSAGNYVLTINRTESTTSTKFSMIVVEKQ